MAQQLPYAWGVSTSYAVGALTSIFGPLGGGGRGVSCLLIDGDAGIIAWRPMCPGSAAEGFEIVLPPGAWAIALRARSRAALASTGIATRTLRGCDPFFLWASAATYLDCQPPVVFHDALAWRWGSSVPSMVPISAGES